MAGHFLHCELFYGTRRERHKQQTLRILFRQIVLKTHRLKKKVKKKQTYSKIKQYFYNQKKQVECSTPLKPSAKTALKVSNNHKIYISK